MTKNGNQIGFRLPPEYVDSFKEEAKKRGMSMHEYSKKMAIQGFLLERNGGEKVTVQIKNIVFAVCLLQEFISESLPDGKSHSVVETAQQNAMEVLRNMGVEV